MSDTGTDIMPQDAAKSGAYAQSFGLMPDKTQYAGFSSEFPIGEAAVTARVKSLVPGAATNDDKRSYLLEKMKLGVKAITTTAGGAGASWYAMTPLSVDPLIVDLSRKNTPLVEIFPRVTNQGNYAVYNYISSKGGAFTAVEDASLTETNTVHDQGVKPIKSLYAVGRVTGQAQASQPSYILAGFQPQGGAVSDFSNATGSNAIQREVLVKAREFKELEENLIINGDADTDATQFDGFIDQISTTNKKDLNTTALELDDLDDAIQYAFDDGGRPNLGVCSSAVFTDIKSLLNAKIGYLQSEQQVFWGFTTIVYRGMTGDIPIIPSMFMSNVSGSKAIYFLDMTIWEVRVLMDMMYDKFGKLNDSDKFMLKGYECLICRAPQFNSWVGEIL